MKMTTGVIMCIIFSLLVLCPPAYSQKIYRWVDEKGNINYTTRYDRIPPQYRDQVSEPPEKAGQKQLIAPEEVTQLFENYVRYYNQKDIERLLSLFSRKAVQNLKDRFDQIREVYSDFFDESQELSYHIDDMKIRIDQNSVYVIDARYKVDQVLKKAGKTKTWMGDIRWILIRENGALKIRYLDYRQQASP